MIGYFNAQNKIPKSYFGWALKSICIILRKKKNNLYWCYILFQQKSVKIHKTSTYLFKSRELGKFETSSKCYSPSGKSVIVKCF